MKDSIITELLKKASQSGWEKIIFTEESLFRLFKELKLPKDLPRDTVTLFVTLLKSTREELSNRIIGELAHFLGRINVARELKNLLMDTTIEIKTEVNFSERKTNYRVSTTRKSKSKKVPES